MALDKTIFLKKLLMTVKISIIMPVYNGERYLSSAIDSVLAQNISDFELVVWDDGSTDRSFSIASSYAQLNQRVRAVAADHRGHAAALNAATAQTTGVYIGWVDSDDLLAPTALKETASILDAHPNVGLVYTDYIVIDESGQARQYGGRCAIAYSQEKLLENFMTFHFRLFRRRVFEQVGGADESLECAVDYDLCLKLSQITEFIHLPQPLYYYRSHSQNVSHQKRTLQDRCSHTAIARAKERQQLSKNLQFELQKVDRTQSRIKKLSFYWSPTKQLFICDDIYYENSGATPTDPSHDLAHLIVAASSELPWLPQKSRQLTCLAEYNAVLLENFLSKTCHALIFGNSNSHKTLAEALEYMRWFVEHYYVPFPVSAEEAYEYFCYQINPFVVTSLFPYYLSVKQYELTHPEFREAEYQLSFTSVDQPAANETSFLAQWSIYQQLKTAQEKVGIFGAPPTNASQQYF